MSKEKNIALVRKYYTALQAKDYTAATTLCHPDFVFYAQLDAPIRGADCFIAYKKKYLDAFAGLSLTIDSIFSEDNHVAAYIIFDGLQMGVIDGIKPRGRRLHLSLMTLLRIKNGKIIEERAHFDAHNIQRQLEGHTAVQAFDLER